LEVFFNLLDMLGSLFGSRLFLELDALAFSGLALAEHAKVECLGVIKTSFKYWLVSPLYLRGWLSGDRTGRIPLNRFLNKPI